MPNNLSVETEDWKPVQAQVPDYYQRGYPLEDIHDIVTGPDGSRIGQRSLCKIACATPTPFDTWLARLNSDRRQRSMSDLEPRRSLDESHDQSRLGLDLDEEER